MYQKNSRSIYILWIYHCLEHTDKAKYLGVTIQHDFKWDSHISNITCTANKTLGFIRRNLKINSKKIKEQAYKSLVRPTLEYACTVWDPYQKGDINKLEMVQRRAARYVTNRFHNTSSVSDMLEHLEWPSLSARRKNARLTMLFKITHGIVAINKDQYLTSQLRPTRHSHTLAYQIHYCRTDSRKHSFFPRTIQDWNSLPQDLVISKSLDSFKTRLSSLN